MGGGFRPIFAAIALTAVTLSACGGARTRVTVPPTSPLAVVPARIVSSPAPSRPGIDDAYDGDDGARRDLEEHDDYELTRYGQPASRALVQAAVLFVTRYYAAASAANGAAACSLLAPSVARGLAENNDTPSVESYVRGASCAESMTKLFVHLHRELAVKAAGIEVTEVRATRSGVRVLLAFRGIRERRYMALVREADHTLKLEGAFRDSAYP